MNTAIILSYDGTAYHGWQTQRNASSVQQTVTEALASLLGQDVSVSGVGRTDAGVHARRYVANFHGTHTIPMDRLPFAINAHLPMDIAVSGAALVPDDFDARFNCTRKEYTYLIAPGKIRDPFAVSRSYFYPYSLDVDAMQQAAQYFIGQKGFCRRPLGGHAGQIHGARDFHVQRRRCRRTGSHPRFRRRIFVQHGAGDFRHTAVRRSGKIPSGRHHAHSGEL